MKATGSICEAPAAQTAQSRVTNGSDILPGVDGRSELARRYRDLVRMLTLEVGHNVGETERLQIRNAATLQIHAELLTAGLVNGLAIDPEALSRAANGATRALAILRRTKPGKPGAPGRAKLDHYLATRAEVIGA